MPNRTAACTEPEVVAERRRQIVCNSKHVNLHKNLEIPSTGMYNYTNMHFILGGGTNDW